MPEKPVPGSALDWLRHARSDLALASVALPQDALYNELCFHAQQAAEKSLKAVLMHRGIPFQKVHDLDYLLTLLPLDSAPPTEANSISSLTGYAVMLRYPGDYEDITVEDYQVALQAAQVVYRWAEAIISG